MSKWAIAQIVMASYHVNTLVAPSVQVAKKIILMQNQARTSRVGVVKTDIKEDDDNDKA